MNTKEAFETFKSNPVLLQGFSDDFKNNPEFIKNCIQFKPEAFQYAGNVCRANKELAILSFSLSDKKLASNTFVFLDDSLKEDSEFVFKIINEDLCYPRSVSLSKNLVNNPDVMLELLSKDKYALHTVESETDLVKYFDFMSKALDIQSDVFKLASTTLKSNKSFILKAVSVNGENIEYALIHSKEWKKRTKDIREISITALKSKWGIKPKIFELLTRDLQHDHEIIDIALKQSALCFLKLSINLDYINKEHLANKIYHQSIIDFLIIKDKLDPQLESFQKVLNMNTENFDMTFHKNHFLAMVETDYEDYESSEYEAAINQILPNLNLQSLLEIKKHIEEKEYSEKEKEDFDIPWSLKLVNENLARRRILEIDKPISNNKKNSTRKMVY